MIENSRIALTFCCLLLALPGSAQVALKSDTPSLLFWTPEQQSSGYRSIEKIYKVATVKHGSKVHPLVHDGMNIVKPTVHAYRCFGVDTPTTAASTSGSRQK